MSDTSHCKGSAERQGLMEAMSVVLGLWKVGVASSEAVVAWADGNIARCDAPPMELVELSLYGPVACTRRAEADFPIRPAAFAFGQEFAIRAFVLSTNDDERVLALADWLSRSCMGKDLADADVALGYQLDHLLCECNDSAAAIATLRAALRDTSERREQTMKRILTSVPELSVGHML